MNDKLMPRRRDVLASGLAAAALAGSGAHVRAAGNLPRNMIDAQVHIWKPGGPPPSPTGRQEPFSAEQLLAALDSGGVGRAVIVTPSWNPDQNQYPLEAAQKYPDRLRVAGLYFDWNKPANPAQIEGWMKPQGMAGIRMFLGSEPGVKWLTGGESDWIWPLLEKHNIPLMISATPALSHLAKIAAKHPGLKMCIDAFGALGGTNKGAAAFASLPAVLPLAKLPNVITKSVSVPFVSGEPYPHKDLQPFVKQIYDAFGPDRIAFASDITLMKTPYKDAVACWTEMDFLSDADRTKIMGGTLAKWLNWPLPA